MKFVTLPLSWFELCWEVILILVYSEDIPTAFHLHFVNFLQVSMCYLLECILSIWQGIRSSHAFVISLGFFLPLILPGPVSRLVVREWLSGHRWWIRSTELTCLHERLGYHDLAKWLSYYLIFLFFFFSLSFDYCFSFYFILFSYWWMCERKVTHKEAWDKRKS